MKEKKNKHILFRLLAYMMDVKWYLLLALVLSIGSNTFSLIGPKLSGLAIDYIEPGAGKVNFEMVYYYAGLMAIFFLTSSILGYLLSVLMIRTSQKVVYKMRKDLFEAISTLPVSYFDTHKTGDILSRMSYDVDVINTSLSNDIIQICTSVITVVGSLAMMLSISPMLVLVFVITVPMSVFVTKNRVKKTRPIFRERSAAVGRLNGFVEEMLAGHKTIAAYERKEQVIANFDVRNEEVVNAYYKADYQGTMTGPSVNFINNLSLSLITVFGAVLYIFGGITLGNISSFVLYSRKFSGPINEVANIMNEFQSAFSAAERVFRVLDEPREAADIYDAKDIEDVEGIVEIKNVNFGYEENKTILKDMSLKAEKGSLTA